MSSVYGTPWLCQISFVGFFAEIPVCTKTICMWTGFFGPTRRGYAAAADSFPGLCASDAQSPKREPLHNKTITAVYRRRRQAPAASVFRIVAPLLCRTADLPLSARSPDRSAAYYHDALRHICQGSKGTSISPASLPL